MKRRTDALEEVEEALLVQMRRMLQSFEEQDASPTIDLFKSLTSIHKIFMDALKMYPEDNRPENINEALLELEVVREKLLAKKREQEARQH